MSIRIHVGDRIRELRQDQGISQEKLAARAKLDRTYINSVENGRRNISIVNLERIAHALGTDLRSFFEDPSFTSPSSTPNLSQRPNVSDSAIADEQNRPD